MKATEILNFLDSMNKEFYFPVLDNYNFDLAQCRLSVFRSEGKWLLTIETVGVNPTTIDNTLYAFSNFLDQKGIILGYDNLITIPGEEWLYDNDGNIVVNPFDIHVCLWEKEEIHLQPSEEDYKKFNLDVTQFSSTTLIRYLSEVMREKLWLDDETIFEELGITDNMPLFYRTDHWNHPDLEKPSENPFFQQLALAIEKNDNSHINNANPNTHWSNWAESDFDNQDS